MTLNQLIDELKLLRDHGHGEADVTVSTPDRVGRYQADYAVLDAQGVKIVVSEPNGRALRR
jgi:hypothetical protein